MSLPTSFDYPLHSEDSSEESSNSVSPDSGGGSSSEFDSESGYEGDVDPMERAMRACPRADCRAKRQREEERRERRKKAFENGNRMHLVHSVMLAVAPILKPRAPRVSGALFAAGIAIFSGSCYAAALTGVRENGRLAPVGGSTLILAWLSLVV